jgi:hypothetical protein
MEETSDLENDFQGISHEEASKFVITDPMNIFKGFKMLMKKTPQNGCRVKCVNLAYSTTDPNIISAATEKKRRGKNGEGEC